MKKLLLKMFYIGIIGFGGGSALIPVIEKEVTGKDAMVTKEEYDKDVVVASLTPGALPVEIAGQIGAGLYGPLGMLASASAMALPGAIITILLLAMMSAANAAVLTQINYVAVGITAFIACLLTEYIREVISSAKQRNRVIRTTVIVGGVFVLTAGKNVVRLFQLDVASFFVLTTLDVLIIAFFGIIYTRCKFRTIKGAVAIVAVTTYICVASGLCGNDMVLNMLRVFMLLMMSLGIHSGIPEKGLDSNVSWRKCVGELVACILFAVILAVPAMIICEETWQYLVNGWLSSFMSFGGGDAYLTIADGLFVAEDMLSEEAFYGSLVPVVNVLPGSILCKTLSGIGYVIGHQVSGSHVVGVLMAVAGFATSVAASCVVVSVVHYLYDRYEAVTVFVLIKRWVRPIIGGLLINVILSLVYQNMKLGMAETVSYKYVFFMFVIYLLNVLLFYKWKKNNAFLVLCSTIAALLLCNVF